MLYSFNHLAFPFSRIADFTTGELKVRLAASSAVCMQQIFSKEWLTEGSKDCITGHRDGP